MVDTLIEFQDIRAIDRLLDILDNRNPVNLLDEEKEGFVASELLQNYEQDDKSMEGWKSLVDAGQELMEQDFNPRQKPWDGAANFKSPIIMNAVLQFGDTASQELLRKADIAKCEVQGKDPDGQKFQQGERVAEHLNYQLNVEMPEWRVEHDRLLYTLPTTGCMFKKSFYDPSLGRNVSDVIYYPNFVVNQANTTIDDVPSFTQILQYTENQVEEKQRTGQWRRAALVAVEDENQEENAADNIDQFLEQQAWWDLDEDGYKEPYIITLHKKTRTVMKIVPRFTEETVFVRVGEQIKTLAELIKLEEKGGQPLPAEIVQIEPIRNLTKYDFLPDPEGGFLGIGYPHLLAGNTQAINSSSNHLLDAGTLSNLPGGYLAKGVRKRLGNDRFRPGEWKGTNVPARDFANAFFPLPYKEPSQALFNFNEKMQAEAERTANSADFSKVLANNAPATTTLALLQKETQSTTSIIRRIYLAMSNEFKVLANLNRIFGDPEKYIEIINNPKADMQVDYTFSQINFVPIANPEMSTRIERVKAGEVQMGFLPQIAEAGGQTQVVIMNFLDALGVENLEQIFPEPQPSQIEQQNMLLEQQNVQKEFENKLFDRELRVREADLQRKIAETQSSIAKTRADIIKTEADAVKTLEEAESEAKKNQITIWQTELQTLEKVLGTLTKELSIEIANRRTTAEAARDRNQEITTRP